MSDELKFEYKTADLEENKEQLLTGFQILKNEKNIEKFFDTDLLTNFLLYVNTFAQKNFGSKNAKEICEFFLQNDFHIELIRFGDYFSEICDQIKIICYTDQEVRYYDTFVLTLYITNFLTAYSRKFSMKFFELNGARHMIKYLNNEKFVETFKSERPFQFILLNLSVLSSEADSFKTEWAELNATDVLLKIAEKDQKFKRSTYGVVLRIADDKKINTIADMPEIVSIFIKSLNKAANEINQNLILKREKMEFEEEDADGNSKQFDVYSVKDDNDNNISYPITGVINTLYKLSVNDKIKYDLYVKYNVKDPLRIVIMKGSDIEKRFALKLLAQLCFDNLVLDMVGRDIELTNYIQKLSVDPNPATKLIPKHSQQILWALNHKTSKEVQRITNQKSQIMISYNSGTRDLCIKIKGELEKAGYKVWIDIDEIHGSSLDSMANAVETSEVVLMCVTENYRQSVNCQAEAQYAFKLKKPIIPLIMQKGYESVGGWLGMIMGDKIFINFTKYAYEEAVSRLLNQIAKVDTIQTPIVNNEKIDVTDSKTKAISVLVDNLAPRMVTTTTIPPTNTNLIPPNVQTKEIDDNLPSKWSEQEVENWFKKDGIMTLYEHLKPCNGELLFQLYEMKQSAPEFFYQFISIENKIDRRAVLVFTNNLTKLFNK